MQPNFCGGQSILRESSQPIIRADSISVSSKCNFFKGSLPSHLKELTTSSQTAKLFNLPSLLFDNHGTFMVILVGYSVAAIIGNRQRLGNNEVSHLTGRGQTGFSKLNHLYQN